GAAHARHRAPFNRPFRHDEVHARLAAFTRAETGRLVSAIAPHGAAELRRATAGPLAGAGMAQVLGLGQVDPAQVLAWYDGIVAAVQAEAAAQAGTAAQAGAAADRPGISTAGADPAGAAAFAELVASLRDVIDRGGRDGALLAEVVRPAGAAGPLTGEEAISNAAVLLFGGIETTEGMIANAVLHLLSSPAQLALVRAEPGLVSAAVEESLRLEPAAAGGGPYATAGTRPRRAALPAGGPAA